AERGDIEEALQAALIAGQQAAAGAVRALRSAPVQRVDRAAGRERKAAVKAQNSIRLPTADQCLPDTMSVPAERQVPCPRSDETVAQILRRVAALGAQVVQILPSADEVPVVEAVSPRIGEQKGKPAPHPPFRPGLQRMIDRAARTAHFIDRTEP